MPNTTAPLLLFHQLNAADSDVTLAGSTFGLGGTEVTGTHDDPSGVVVPSVRASGLAGFYNGFVQQPSNVVDDVVFGTPEIFGTLGAPVPANRVVSSKDILKMSKTVILVDENPVFGVTIKQNGQLADVQGGTASLGAKSLTVVREGATIELDPTAGVVFAKVGAVNGVYSATYTLADMLLADGTTPFVQQDGDDYKFLPDAEVVAGEPRLVGVEDTVCVIAADEPINPTASWSVG